MQPGYDLTLSLDQTDRLLDDKLNVVETFASEGLAPTMQFPLTPNTTPTEVMQGFLRLKELKGEREHKHTHTHRDTHMAQRHTWVPTYRHMRVQPHPHHRPV